MVDGPAADAAASVRQMLASERRGKARMAMTKRILIEELLARHQGLSHRDSEAIVNAMFDAMAYGLARGERIEIRGFGSFGVKQRRARQGRNPKTGETVAVAAKRIPFFRAGKELRAEVNVEAGVESADSA
jgi:integration host factor subunit beta